jgi:hypothetical protein
VRRTLAISLLMLFLLPFAQPLFGASAEQATVPVCCRKNGKHHCMMASRSPQRIIGQKCPFHIFPPAVSVVPSFAPSTSASVFAGIVQHPVVTPQVGARQRVSYDRTRQKRGPPVFSI